MEKKNKSFKTVAVVSAILISINTLVAQTPQAIPYQAAARNNSGVIIPNKTIALRFSVHDVSASGTVVYKETQTATTNMLGMFIVNIGQGAVVSVCSQNKLNFFLKSIS